MSGRPWRGEKSGRRVIVLPPAHIRRLIERNASALILTRAIRLSRVAPDYYEIHDALTIRHNERRRRHGRPDLQEDPLVLAIEISAVTRRAFGDLDLVVARASGFETVEDLHDDWAERHRDFDADRDVYVCAFHAIGARFLHQLPYRGYTSNPAEAADGEPEALAVDELEEITTAARERWNEAHAEETARREARQLGNSLKEAQMRAANRGLDITPEVTAIRLQLDAIRAKLEDRAA